MTVFLKLPSSLAFVGRCKKRITFVTKVFPHQPRPIKHLISHPASSAVLRRSRRDGKPQVVRLVPGRRWADQSDVGGQDRSNDQV